MLAVAFGFAGQATVTGLPRGLVGGLLVLALVGGMAYRWRWPPIILGVASLPGAWLMATDAGLPSATWLRTSVVLVTTVGGALLADFDARHPESVPLLLAGTCAGVYVIVPDTQWALVFLGAAIGVVIAGWPLGRASVGSGGPLVCGVLGWVVAVEGYPRPGAVVAALACLGVLAAEPLGRRLGSGLRGGASAMGAMVIAEGLGVALLHAAGHQHYAAPVVADAAAVLAAMTVSLALMATLTGGRRPTPRT